MIIVDIPGYESLAIEHVLLDYNGTIGVDGFLVPEAADLIRQLAQQVHVVVLTADTYGTVQEQCAPLGVEVFTFPRAGAAQFKQDYAQRLKGQIASLGNGRNDTLMFDCSALSIAVMDGEGLCAGLLSHADIVVRSSTEGLDLLLHPDRIRATLRS